MLALFSWGLDYGRSLIGEITADSTQSNHSFDPRHSSIWKSKPLAGGADRAGEAWIDVEPDASRLPDLAALIGCWRCRMNVIRVTLDRSMHLSALAALH